MPQCTWLANDAVFAQEGQQKARPRRESTQEEWYEIIPRMKAAVHFRGKAQKVLADEEKVEKIGIGLTDKIIPGNRNGAEQ